MGNTVIQGNISVYGGKGIDIDLYEKNIFHRRTFCLC